MSSEQFYSNGKLLLTSEYLVLKGAEALAVPTLKGQSLTFTFSYEPILKWKSYDCDNQIWFEAVFNIEDFSLKTLKGEEAVGLKLKRLLQQSRNLNPNFLKTGGYVETHLDFNRNWGLGSSSTLINNLAKWGNINPFQLLWSCFEGSGYDIACAEVQNPILYTRNNDRPSVEQVHLTWPFKESIFFVHLNKKQDTSKSLASFKKQQKRITNKHITLANQLTREIVLCDNLKSFELLLYKHEQLMSEILGVLPIKEQFFKDFSGAIKSLGAWGGDFMMVTSDLTTIKSYFEPKGYTTIIPFKDLIV